MDLSYTQILVDADAKNSLEQHPSLIKLDLNSTKCSDGNSYIYIDLSFIEEVRMIESVLIRKSVKQNLAYKKLNKN